MKLDTANFDSVHQNEMGKDSVQFTAIGKTLNPSQTEIDEMHHFSKKSNYEIEMPELAICYKENSYLGIKDICVDEEMASCERMLFENDDLRTLLLLEKGSSMDTVTEATEFSDPTPDYLKFSEDRDFENPDNQAYSEEIRQTEVKVHGVTEYASISQMLIKGEESAKEISQEKPSSEHVCSGHTEMPPKVNKFSGDSSGSRYLLGTWTSFGIAMQLSGVY
ncbi:hypothetical protein SAY86_008642 [Trapa natans]|uniref:Uncharacterized protein n=1 Tax=Trapa natans TaxID=22666 RepID=A0AAN7QBH5_TRANT|nr:hypothetical protein SAY86_008642 [Trapa natans]